MNYCRCKKKEGGGDRRDTRKEEGCLDINLPLFERSATNISVQEFFFLSYSILSLPLSLGINWTNRISIDPFLSINENEMCDTQDELLILTIERGTRRGPLPQSWWWRLNRRDERRLEIGSTFREPCSLLDWIRGGRILRARYYAKRGN